VHDGVAQHERLAHDLAAQVEVAIAQAHGLLDRAVLVERERRGLGHGQALGLGDLHLDLAGRQVRVLVALLALDDRAADRDHVLGPQRLGGGERVAGMEDQLHEAGAVAQVDEDEPAVVAAAVHPAGEPDVAARVAGAQVAAPGVAVAVGARRLLHRTGPRSTSRTTSVSGTARWSPLSMSFSCAPSPSTQAT
jgi:hypothetical protein